MNRDGIALLKEFEGFRANAYRDPVGVWTIGYGFTKGVAEGQTITRAKAEYRLLGEIEPYERAVIEACPDANENQLAAMTCLAYNIGVDGFRRSTVRKAHNRGDYQSAARAFGLWNKAGSRVFAGLTRRRAAEAALYLKPVDGEELDMPQAVEPESNLRSSPLMSAGGATAVASITSVAAQVASDVGSVKDNLGDALPLVILIAAVAGIGFGGFTAWQRYKQRKDGWA